MNKDEIRITCFFYFLFNLNLTMKSQKGKKHSNPQSILVFLFK